MSSSVRALLSLTNRDTKWVWRALQTAVELELATIPPYLCALWSIKDETGPVYDALRRILAEEMEHLGLACNLKAAFGKAPRLVTPWAAPRYPGPLPGGVHPGLRVALRPLSKDVVGSVFMQIEFPSPEAVTYHGARHYWTIGAFYEQIAVAIANPTVPFVGGHQLSESDVNVFELDTRQDALDAIDMIRSEGEGAHGSPFLSGKRLAHYYQFAEIFWERKIIPCKTGWGFCGPKVPFPKTIFDVAVVPSGGYPGVPKARAFSKLYTHLLSCLDRAWSFSGGGQAFLDEAVDLMLATGQGSMYSLARDLMQMKRPNLPGNYCPDFRVIR